MKNAVNKQTARILRQIINYIAKEPKRLDMGDWGNFLPPETKMVSGINYKRQPAPPCGTTGCVAGTCLLVTKAGLNFLNKECCFKKDAISNEYVVTFPDDTPNEAQRILGISDKQAAKLFYFQEWNSGEGWPKKFADRYKEAVTARGRFFATKARIEHFIKTGE